MEKKITFTVNGKTETIITEPDRPLLDVLREELRLTGAKYGCGEGQCGACTVLIDDRTAHACITPAERADGKTVRTIEGLSAAGELHPVQAAFLEEGAMQCGYCTPGMILSAVSLLEQSPHPTDAQIRSRMEGHLCRCGGYARILKAIRRAAAPASR